MAIYNSIMGYIDDNLMDGERVVFRSRKHWVVFLGPAVIFSLFVLALIYLLSFISVGNGLGLQWILFLFIGPIFFFIYLNRKFSEYAVTNKRVVMKVGVFRTDSVELLLTRVEGIEVSQGILGRILSYGTVIIRGTGGTPDNFLFIENPLEFRNKALEQSAVSTNSLSNNA